MPVVNRGWSFHVHLTQQQWLRNRRRYLNKRTRTCYWVKLLSELSKELKYKVSPVHELEEHAAKLARKEKTRRPPAISYSGGPCAGSYDGKQLQPGELGCWMTVERYLKTVARRFEGGKHVTHIEEF